LKVLIVYDTIEENEKRISVENNENIDAKRLLASFTTETLNSLADLIVSKLRTGRSDSQLSKQVVTGSNPVSRSKFRR
jgi:hypothetical protein